MLEGRIASIAACLAQLTAQEEAREARRQDLAAQVGDSDGGVNRAGIVGMVRS
jgi:hypothetical protein